jgi:hypothetical protein
LEASVYKDTTAVRSQQSGKDRQGGRFAGAVGSEQRGNFTGLHREADIVEREAIAVAL